MFPLPLGSTDPRLPRILSLSSHPAMATLPPDCAQEPHKTLHSPCLVPRSVPGPGELWGRGLPFHLPTGCSGDMPTSCPRSPGHTGGQASPASCLITQGSHLETLSQCSCFPPSHRGLQPLSSSPSGTFYLSQEDLLPAQHSFPSPVPSGLWLIPSPIQHLLCVWTCRLLTGHLCSGPDRHFTRCRGEGCNTGSSLPLLDILRGWDPTPTLAHTAAGTALHYPPW